MRSTLAAFVFLSILFPAHAQAPFEQNLLRLSEILGSLHYLSNLCGDQTQLWREMMQRMIETENPDDQRKAQFNASFNRGYRSFASAYTSCTPAATEAIARYRQEGERLAGDTATRFGN